MWGMSRLYPVRGIQRGRRERDLSSVGAVQDEDASDLETGAYRVRVQQGGRHWTQTPG